MVALVEPLLFLCPLFALGLGIAGIVRDERKLYAIAALAISGLLIALTLLHVLPRCP